MKYNLRTISRSMSWWKLFSNTNKEPIGLYTIPVLKEPSSFREQASITISRCEIIRNYLHSCDIKSEHDHDPVDNTSQNKRKVDPKQILQLMDAISNFVCQFTDPAELCRNTHTNQAFRDSANDACGIFSSYINVLNGDVVLYNLLCTIVDKHLSRLTPEERVFAIDLKREYENEGIHLSDTASPSQPYSRDSIKQIQDNINFFESNFLRNVSENDNEIFEFGPVSETTYRTYKKWTESVVPPEMKPPNDSSRSGYYLYCVSNKALSTRLMASIDEAEIREQVWIKSNKHPQDNKEMLGQLIKSRQELAMALGYPSYAHKVLSVRYALSEPSKVINFLDSLSDKIRVKAEEEIKILSDFRSSLVRRDMMSSSSISSLESGISPWDYNYLILAYRQEVEQKSASHAEVSDIIRPYFTVDVVLKGLEKLTRDLFGVTVKRDMIKPSEGWTQSTTIQDGIVKYIIVDENSIGSESSPLGVLYLDLYGREGKYQGSGHFTIRCGCHTISHSQLSDMISLPTDKPSEGVAQIPVIFLSFSFISPAHSSSSRCITLSELETLYHEWGHALHSLLSRTRFQHLSGTRCSLDFAEVPSHLMEYFARSPEVICSWAHNPQNGRKLTQDILVEAFQSRSHFEALSLQKQIFISAVDQFVFGPELDWKNIGNMSANEIYNMVEHGAARLQKKYSSISLPTRSADNVCMSDMPLLTHSHFIGYGGAYFSYIFAKMYAAQIWEKRFKSDPLSRVAAGGVVADMLKYGASKPSAEILFAAAGGPLDPKHFLSSIITNPRN